MAMNHEQIIETLKSMTLQEVNALVKALEEEFGVSGTPVMMAGGAGAGAGATAAAAEEKSAFSVVLKSAGDNRIQVIKVVREATGLGLKEAKDLVDQGGNILENVPKDQATDLKAKLEEAGAVADIV